MKEALDSVKDALKGRLTNPAYGAFIIYWLIFHWQFVFSLFALDQNLVLQNTGLLKNVYLAEAFFNTRSFYFWVSWIAPFVLTGITIWHLPRWVLLPAFQKEEEYKTKKAKIKIKAEESLEAEQVKLEVAKTTTLEAVVKKAEKEKEVKEIIPEQAWLSEYISLKNTPSLFVKFNSIIECIYEHNGNIIEREARLSQRPIKFQVPKEILAYAHTNYLINFDATKTKIDLTDKGRFFVKEYSTDKVNN